MPHRRRNKSKEDGTSGVVSAGPDKKSTTTEGVLPSQTPRKDRAKKTTQIASDNDIHESKNPRPLEEEGNASANCFEAFGPTPPSSLLEASSAQGLKAETASLEDGFASLSTWSPTEPWKEIGHFQVDTSCVEDLGATGESMTSELLSEL